MVVFGWKVCPKVVKSEEKSDKVKKKGQTASKILDPGNLKESIVFFYQARLATLCHFGEMMGEIERQRLAVGTELGAITISH